MSAVQGQDIKFRVNKISINLIKLTELMKKLFAFLEIHAIME